MSPSQIIVLAMPVFLVMIAAEYLWGQYQQRRGTGRHTYRLSDALTSLSLGVMSQITALFTHTLRIGLYVLVYQALSLVPHDAARAFWTSWPGWVLALVFYDLCYYWQHRMGHEVAALWAAHVVHHQSQDYNLSTALRQSSSVALLTWMFYFPMAMAGVPPLVFAVVALVDLLYQFWVHTEQVGRLGWFDRWFCSPSNHRVHHAVNDVYLDKNYGGILMLWDHWFGSFKDEDPDAPCVYGTRKALDSWDPLWANLEVYAALARSSWQTRRWADKLRVWLKPPGWQPPDLAASEPLPPFVLSSASVYQVSVRPWVHGLAVLKFVLLLGGAATLLWVAEDLPGSQAFVAAATLTMGLWTLGALLQKRLTPIQMGLIDLVALSFGALGLGAFSLGALSPLP